MRYPVSIPYFLLPWSRNKCSLSAASGPS